MNIKKILVLSLLAVCLLGCITTVNAGLFDFLGDDLTEHDFGEFTMNVPKNTTFKDSVQPNGDDAVDQMAKLYSKNGYFSINYSDPKWADPEYKNYLHPSWDADDESIFINYIDCKEDNLTKDNAVEACYTGYDKVETKGDTTLYHSDEWGFYLVRKDNGDKSVVLVSNKDKDLLLKMADSIKFKE